MYEYFEIQNKWNWSIRVKTAVRVLHLEMSNLNNTHENASALANNITNQVARERDHCGKVKLELQIARDVVVELEPLSHQ